MHQGGFFSGKDPGMHAVTLLDAFSRLDDPRCRRGVRHPFAGIVVLTLLGMLARIREMEVLVRWATVHWDQLKEPLGFHRDAPPCAATISRTLAGRAASRSFSRRWPCGSKHDLPTRIPKES